MQVKTFFDTDSHTASHVVIDTETNKCAIIDPVMDWNNKNYTTDIKSADEVISFVKGNNLEVEWILETHMHADHLTASQYLKEKLGGSIAIGDKITVVQKALKDLFNLNDNFRTDGSQFDKVFADNEEFTIGSLKVKALSVPGHTPACIMFDIEGVLFVGDTIFMPDVGTARCDFPGGNADTLWQSIQKILSYTDDTKIYLCHDYAEGKDRDAQFVTTVGEEKSNNIHVKNNISKEEFLKMRKDRDITLDLPSYIFPSMHINMRAGHLPEVENNKMTYLQIPINWWNK